MEHRFFILPFLSLLFILFGCKKDDDASNGSGVESFDITANYLTFENIGGASSMEKIPTGGFILVGDILEGTVPSNFNMQLTKLDEQCNVEWSKSYGGTYTQYGKDVWPTSDGGFILAGTTQNMAQGLNDIFIVKTDKFGNSDWEKNLGGTAGDIPESIIQTPDGGFLFVGKTEVNFLVEGTDAYFVRLNENGNEIWTKKSGNPIEDYAYEIIPSNDGHFVVLGTELASLIFPTQYLTLEKIDIDSNTIWPKKYSHDIGRAAEHAVIQDNDNGYLIATTLGDKATLSNSDLLLLKTDENGDEIWNKTFGGNKNEESRTLIRTSDNHLIFLGITASYGDGASDIMVVKTDNDGNEIWTKTYGGSEFFNPHDIKEMGDGGFIICGAIKGSGGQFDFDLFILKIDPDGIPL